jgi:hypothetical protein
MLENLKKNIDNRLSVVVNKEIIDVPELEIKLNDYTR